MINKVSIIFVFSCFLVGLLGILYDVLTPSGAMLGITHTIMMFGGYAGVAVMLQNSTIIKTNYFKIVLFCAVLIVLSMILTVMHFPYYNTVLTISLLGILITYLVWFYVKKTKQLLDILKLLFVAGYCVGRILIAQGWADSIPIPHAGEFLFLPMFFYFAYLTLKQAPKTTS